MIAYFGDVGTRIASRWEHVNFDNIRLPDIACDVLASSPPGDNSSYDSIIDWVVTTRDLPPQPGLNATFGQPTITVFWHPRFSVEVLFWATGTTAVHQHGFSGAFTLLEGTSLQSHYRFDVEHRVNAHMLVGTLSLRDVRLLSIRDVQPIISGPGLIHSVFHLESPTVTALVRTHTDVEQQPQYNYHRPHLAIDPVYEDAVATRRVQVLELLARVESERYEDVAAMALQHADLFGTFQLLKSLRSALDSSDAFDRLVGVARQRHGPCVDKLRAVTEEVERERILTALRHKFTAPHARFLLALLLNVPSREGILTLVGQRYPGTDPKATCARLAFDLSGADTSGIEFDELNQSLFRLLMDGLPVPDVLGRLSREYDRDDIERLRPQLEAQCAAMRTSNMFGVLLAEA